MSAYALTAKMAWDIKASSWETFPIVQQWFATGETLAHLRFLEEEGWVTREMSGATVGFLLSGRAESACPQRALTTLLFKN